MKIMRHKNVDVVRERELHFNKIKSEIGITLVALVVTLIILLILAGISIASLTGNGLFEKAKLAKEKQENAETEENITLADYENKIGEYIDSTREENNKQSSGIQKTDLYYGKADTKDTEYLLSDDVANYSFLVVYATLGDSDINNRGNIGSIVIDTSDIIYNRADNAQYVVDVQLISGSSLYTYAIRFGFLESPNESGEKERNKFKINTINKGSGYSPYPAYIYKIVGIK